MIRIAVGYRLDAAHLGSQGLEQCVFFRRLVVRHHDDAAVATRVADMRQANAGVARGALHHRAAGLELSAPFGIEHDRARGTILDRAARIHEFRLAEDLAAGLIAEATQSDQRRVAHGIDETAGDVHDSPAAVASTLCTGSAARAARRATSPTISSAGAATCALCACALMSPRQPAMTRWPGKVACSTIAGGRSASAPCARSSSTMRGSCATPM